MLAIEWFVSLTCGAGKRGIFKHFDIEPVRKSGRRNVAEIVDLSLFETTYRLIHQCWIDQGAISRNAYDHIRFDLLCCT